MHAYILIYMIVCMLHVFVVCIHDYYVHSYAYIKGTLYDCMYSHHQIDGNINPLLI